MGSATRAAITTAGTILAGVILGFVLVAPWTGSSSGGGGASGDGAEATAGSDEAMRLPEGGDITAARVMEACEREIVARSDLPFTEFPREGTPDYREPFWDAELEAWVWIVEVRYEEGMALRRQWECRVTPEGEGRLRRNY